MTNIYNRRYFNQFIEKEIERSKRYNYPVTFVMFDIDRFKEINDRYGHKVGDDILKGIAKFLEGKVRLSDTLVRYGGDEFLIIMPEIDQESLDGFIDRIRYGIKEYNRDFSALDFDLELSIGVASFNSQKDESIDNILHAADMNMYEDKRKKKNRSLLN